MRQFLLYFFILISVLCFGQKNQRTIGFIENKGQIIDQKGKENKNVKFLLNTPGLNVQLKKNAFSYDIYETIKNPLTEKDKAFFESQNKIEKKGERSNYSLEYKYHRIDIDFLNSNQSVKLVAEEKSADYDNYYNIAHAPQGITGVHKYQKVTYNNIYNNIDAVFFIPKDTTKVVEYNFIVKPGGKISDIQLKFNGVKTELIDNKIKMNVRFGQMEETIPLSWVEQGDSRKEIKVGYKKIMNNVYGFEGEMNASDKIIVIDPVPVRLWGTYYGGNAYDFYTSTVKVDHLDNVYITGQTVSTDNIATLGAFQNLISYPITAAYIGKLDSNGVRLWGSYIHNYYPSIPINQTTIYDIAINSFSEIYIAGLTRTASGLNNITTPGSHKEFQSNNYTSADDGFILKFNSNGMRIWGTLFGGESRDHIKTITLDNQENLIIAGETHSNSEISTPNSFQTTRNNQYGPVGFFSKFSSAGNQLYGSYFPREIYESTIDNSGNLIFAGQYEIANYYPDISTSGAYQTQTYHQDGFIIKFDSSFNRLWSTYYGGDSIPESISPNADVITSISTDINNNIYICGYTDSQTNITTSGAFKESHTDPNSIFDVDTFLVKFNSQGVRQWGTFFGSNTSEDKCYDGMVANNGDFYFVGQTTSLNNIATPGSYQPHKNPYEDGFFGKFDTNGQLIWSSYFGGNFYDAIYNIDVKNNMIYFSGNTGSSDVISTPGTHKTFVEGGDAFIEKFLDCQSTAIIFSNSPICIGKNLQLNASGGSTYSWTGPNGFTSTDQNPIITNANATHSGQYSCTITGTGGCDNTLTINVVVGDNTAPVPDITNLPTITGDCNTVITTIPTATDNCAGIITATTTNPLNYSTPGTYTIIWNYNDGNGNTSSQNQTVVISTTALATATSSQQFCIQQNATLNDVIITGQNIQWHDAQSGGNLLSVNTFLQNGVTYYASQTINGCKSDRIPVSITIQNTPAPTGNTTQSFCSSQNAALNNIAVLGTNINWYNSLTGNTILSSNTLLTDNTTYYATQTVNNCESPTRLTVTVTLINTLNANDYSETICDDLNNSTETINLSNYNSNLIAITSGNTFTYYHSQNGAENQISSDEINNFSNYNLSIGNNIVFVRIDSINSCHQVVMLNLNLVNKPIIPINDIMPICEGSSITVNAGTGFDSYLWSTSEMSQSINISTPGNYSVAVTKNHGSISCTSVKNFTVTNSNAAIIHEIITSDWTSNQNTISVLLTTNSNGDYLYSIDGINYQTSNTFSNLTNGEYTIFVKDNNGCGITSEEVYLLMYPHFFTPNEDGYNDTWKIEFSEIEPNLTIKIFNRFGKLLKELDSNSKGWNGTYLGQPLPSDDYWFVVKRNNGKEFRGHFALKR